MNQLDHASRRSFLALGATGVLATWLPATPARARPITPARRDLAWRDVREWGVEGRGWTDTEAPFDRLPARAHGVVRDVVWNLSRHPAGQSARFITNASEIHVRYTLTSDYLAMPHMPATGVSGVDLYARDERGQWRWVSVVKPAEQSIETRIIGGLEPVEREYMLYLPLYNGVTSLEIGVDDGAFFEGRPPREEKPIVFYGTSITHGACASRPGMAHVAITGRQFDRPVINLGFSGNGRMEKEVGAFLCELDPAMYVIDCLPNMNANQVTVRTEPLVLQLRAARPDTAIVLCEGRSFANTPFLPERQRFHADSHTALRGEYERLRDDGVEGVWLLPGQDLIGDDGDGTTDGSHPNDLGMKRFADAMRPTLERVIAAG